MPNVKSAKKRLRTNERQRRENVGVKSALRKEIRNYRAAESRSADDLGKLYASLDRAAKKGVIPTRRADRLKGRLSRLTDSPSA